MVSDSIENLQYPIGKFNLPDSVSKKQINKWIEILEVFPTRLNELTSLLTDQQLNTTYRPQGWTIRQVVHHLADSHYNSYIRFKWTLTEKKPVIKAYYEDRWAELIDSKTAPIELSINALNALHAKWVFLLKTLSTNELQTHFIHPDGNKKVTLLENIGIYAWHCDHHFAHIKNLIIRMNW